MLVFVHDISVDSEPFICIFIFFDSTRGTKLIQLCSIGCLNDRFMLWIYGSHLLAHECLGIQLFQQLRFSDGPHPLKMSINRTSTSNPRPWRILNLELEYIHLLELFVIHLLLLSIQDQMLA